MSASENDDVGVLLQIIDTFKIPKLIYNIERKKFMLASKTVRDLHGGASDKAALFRDRQVFQSLLSWFQVFYVFLFCVNYLSYFL